MAALRPAGAAYKKAAAEGRAKDRNGYKREGSKALAARADMKGALAGLATAGYELPSGLVRSAGDFTRLPTLKKDPKPKAKSSGGGGGRHRLDRRGRR